MHQLLPGRHPFLSLRALFAALAVCAAEPEPALPDELKALPAGAVAAGARMPTPRHVVEAIRTCYAIDLLQACRDDFGPGTVEALSPLLGQIQALRARERVLYDMQAEYLERIELGRTTLGKARPVLEKTGARIAEHVAAQARLLEEALHGPEGVHNDPALPHAGRVRVPGPAAGRGGGRRGWRATSHPPTRRAADPLLRNKVALLHRLSDEAETMLTCAPWASWGALYGERETSPFLKWEDQALVLVDGFRVNDSQTSHHNLDLPLPLDAMNSIEVLHGAGSTLHGADALSGVVDFLTAAPSVSSLRLRAGDGSFGENEESLLGDLVRKRWSSRLAAERNFSTGFLAVPGADPVCTPQQLYSDCENDRDYRNEDAASENWLSSRLGISDGLLAASDRSFGANQFSG